MIITQNKTLTEMLECIGSAKNIFLIGCTLCATTCKTGGEKDLARLEKIMVENGKIIIGTAVLDPACNKNSVKRMYRKYSAVIDGADAVLAFSCGVGTQTIAEVLNEIRVLPGNETLFLGEITKLDIKGGRFERRCSQCGECMLAHTGGVCPVTRCPKGLVNGPCGGIKNGSCEIDPNKKCVWLDIYERLKKQGDISKMRKIYGPKDHSKNKKTQYMDI